MPQSSVRRGIAALLGRTRKAEVFPLLGPMGSTIHQQLGLQSGDLAEGGAILDSLQEGQLVFLAPPTALVVAVSRHTEGSRHRCPLQGPGSPSWVCEGLAVLQEMATMTSAWVKELRCDPCPDSGPQACPSLGFTPFLSHCPFRIPHLPQAATTQFWDTMRSRIPSLGPVCQRPQLSQA